MNKFDKPMMETAKVWANMSKCKRGKVGAVIAIDSNIITVGYNGTPSGYKHNGEYDCEDYVEREVVEEIDIEICPQCHNEVRLIGEYDEGNIYFCDKCNIKLSDVAIKTKKEKDIYTVKELKTDHSRVIHAEANALMFAARKGYPVEGATLYVTMSPCPNCALLIAQAKIKEVVYLEQYRDDAGIRMLKKLGVKIRKLEK